uniref:Uncharacterized protein n=1 Tax=Zea mays TaxID=4577 RepID=A0A804LRV2_MAIZE
MGHALAEPRPPRRLAGTPLEPPIARAARSGPATLPPPPSSGNLRQRAVTPDSERRVASHSTRAARPPGGSGKRRLGTTAQLRHRRTGAPPRRRPPTAAAGTDRCRLAITHSRCDGHRRVAGSPPVVRPRTDRQKPSRHADRRRPTVERSRKPLKRWRMSTTSRKSTTKCVHPLQVADQGLK